MITPKLEELIWCGKAFAKTAVVGGSKTTINIDQDRFIIITDITFLPYQEFNGDLDAFRDINTQLSIYGEKGFNHYIFANWRLYSQNVFDGVDVRNAKKIMPMPVQTINTYLLHTTQVGFSFITPLDSTPVSTLSIASWNNPAYTPPLDFGKDGDLAAVNIDSDISPTGGLLNQVVNRATGLGVGSGITQQIQYAANNATRPVVNGNIAFPIANINYIEILGQPNNIGL